MKQQIQPDKPIDYKRLLQQVEKTLEAIDTTTSSTAAIEQVAETISTNFREELGITGGRLYQSLDEETYELVGRFGTSHDGELGIQVSKHYKPLQIVLENGIVVMDPSDPAFDPVLEQQLGARRFAAIAVGDEMFVLSFNVSPALSREDILFSLNLIRYAIHQKLRVQRFESLIGEAQRIQQSILPQSIPRFKGFDIWGKTVPADFVSGDFYDFIPLSDHILGLAIADGSGHGLPAALVVRDIYMGLRMGTDRDFKIVRTMEKLNHIIHRSRITTKFVSLFYGELEITGTIIYCNAGHNYPFIVRGHRIERLTHGGPVLGPTPDARYTRGFGKLNPGDLLCLYSDGIVEAHNTRGKEFGIDRLHRLVVHLRHGTAREIGREVLHRVARWGRKGEDDRTIVIVKAVSV